MDYAQYLRLKQEAANVYLSRTKTVDSSLLTFNRQMKAAYGGGTANVNPTPTPVPYDKGSCPADHQMTQGFQSVPNLIQEGQIARAAGAAICCGSDPYTGPPGITLLNCSTVNTILTSFNNNTPAPGQWPAYGYGQDTYFPRPDNATSGCESCGPNKYPYSSG